MDKNQDEQTLENEKNVGVDEMQDGISNTNEEVEVKVTEEESDELDELTRLSIEVQEAKDKYLRLYSEFENFRRRTAKERLDLIGSATENLMTAILPVIDDFERADKAFDEKADTQSLKEGYDLIFNKLKNATEQKGLKKMEHKAGDDFDPEFHDAVTQIPVEDEKLKGKIVDVLENGYLLNDKVIRFAKVVTGA